MKNLLFHLAVTSGLLSFTAGALAQGSLAPSGPPAPTMKTLEQIEPRTPISSPAFTITQSGSYYVTTNLVVASGFGIRVSANDVLLDLGGWTVASSAGSSEGIFGLSGRTNITVRNGTVRGFSAGVHLRFVSGAKIENVTAIGNTASGISVGAKSVIADSLAIGNGGSGFQAGMHCEIRACRSHENGAAGFFISHHTAIHDSLAISNSFDGFQVGNGVTLRGCEANNNIQVGIRTQEKGSLSGCSAKNNDVGIVTGPGSFIRDSSAMNNTGSGFQGYAASQYVEVRALDNGVRGISLESDNVLIQRSTITGNTSYGIFARNGSVISDCLIASNTSAGIIINGSRNRIENNTLIRNASYGVFNGFFAATTNNLVIRNHASGHTTFNFAMGSANHLTVASGANVTTNLNPYVNFSLP